jgi:integrase
VTPVTAPGPDGLLFCSTDGTYLYRTTLRRHWVAARDKVGLEAFTIHDLRHTGHTLAAGTGATVKELMRRLGHSSAQAALRYQHATEDRDQGIARALSALIDQHKPEPIVDVVSLPERVQDRQEAGS